MLKRNAWVMVLALALSGAMVAGCSGSDDPENDGGSGGSGGTGGTGGTGGNEVKCTPECNDGETCHVVGSAAVCRCTDTSCEPFGQVCNDELRCEDPAVPEDFDKCDNDGEEAEGPEGGVLVCTSVLNNSGGLWWLRVCETTDHCPFTETVCLNEMSSGGLPICYFNFCGIGSIGPQIEENSTIPSNGVPFGGCSSSKGYLADDADPSEVDGVCQVLVYSGGELGGLCITAGTVEKRESGCEYDAYRNERSVLCGQDSQCLFNSPSTRDSCTSDAQCTQVPMAYDPSVKVAGYCAKDGKCFPLGFCGEVCNSGTGAASAQEYDEENAKCDDPNGACLDISGGDNKRPVQVGYCRATCTMFELDSCKPFPGDQQRLCFPAFEGLEGSCVPQADAPKPIGAECDGSLAAMECPDDAICAALGDDAKETCLAWCHCPGGWDTTTSICNDAAVNDKCASAKSGTKCLLADVTDGVPADVGICASPDVLQQ